MVDWLSEGTVPPAGGSVVTIGSFDGVHRGHQALIQKAVQAAEAGGATAVGLTLFPHPLATLRPEQAPALIQGIEARTQAMRQAGLEAVYVLRFDAALADISADDFVERILVQRLAPKAVVVGFNFSYGQARSGNLDHLRSMGRTHGFEVHVVEPVMFQDQPVSSTRLREALSQGNLPMAETLLGRRVSLEGVVVKGDQRGRTLGFPTANIDPDAELLPKNGGYATRITLEDGRTLDGVTNIGMRPTFSGDAVRVETFIFDFSGDLYGQTVSLDCVGRIRDERRFDGPDALKSQLAADCEAAREILSP